jgi:hypothetical protein
MVPGSACRPVLGYIVLTGAGEASSEAEEPRLTRGIEFDVARYPLVIIRVGASYTQADWNQLMKRMIEVIQMGPFGLINDTRESPMPDALQRRSIAEMYSEHEANVRKNFLASGIVGSSTLVNGVLTALNWLKPPPHPVKVLNSTAAAEEWVLSRFSTEMCEQVAKATPARAVTYRAS